MAWFNTRQTIYAICSVSLAVLLFSKSLGIDITKGLLSTPLTWAILIGAGQVYIIYAMWKTYI